MFETYLAASEMVLFWESESIDKVMMFSDFQATLDGYVGIPSYAGDEKRAAYVQLDDNLKVRRCVLFLIGFDASGFPERSWNLPLRHMAEIAGRGPDMGGGPINLVCHSQCPISWHAIKLWDPVMRPTLNTFVQISAAVESAADRYSLRPAGVASASSSPAAAPVSDADIPVLTDEAPLPQVQPLTVAKAALWEQEKQVLLDRMAAQQLHISTLDTDKNETIARLGFLHQQQSDILEAQNSKLLGQNRVLKEQFDNQREQIEALRQQIVSAGKLEENLAEERRLHEEQLAALMHAKVGEETQKFEQLLKQKDQEFVTREARLRAEYQLSVEKRLSEEASRFQLQTESLRAELNYREDTINALTKEMAEVKSGNAQREQGAADEFLKRLEAMGMNFVVFHAGAGHVSVPVPELATYVSSPLSYAAAKCMVTPEQYQSWLAHYESPRCNAVIGDNKCCDARLIRTDSPTRFVSGQSDRCARHQAADTAIDNVLRFR